MQKAELSRIVEESSAKLVRAAVPPVRFWLLYDVMGKGPEDSDLKRVIEECKRYPPRVRLLETLRKDGTWPISRDRKAAEDAGPGPPYGWTYTTMLRNLYELGECCTSKDDGRVGLAIDRILSWQTPEGYIPGPSTDGIPQPQHMGLALRDVMKLGERRDPRVRRQIEWLLERQRPDGGWVIPYLEDLRYLPEYRYLKVDDFTAKVRAGDIVPYRPSDHYHIPSCIWTTLMVVRGLNQDLKLCKGRAAKRGASFFLDRFFQRNFHAAYHMSEENWTRLKYPTYLGSGLVALDMLSWMGFGPDDPRMDKPIKWLVSCRSKDGMWHRSDRPEPVTDQWITEIAVSIVARYRNAM